MMEFLSVFLQVMSICAVFFMLGYSWRADQEKARKGRKAGRMHYWTLKRKGDGWEAV